MRHHSLILRGIRLRPDIDARPNEGCRILIPAESGYDGASAAPDAPVLETTREAGGAKV